MKEIVIEEVLPPRPDAVGSTVVRGANNESQGIWVSTVPSSLRTNAFEIKAFRFTGYEQRVGRTAIPKFNLRDDPTLGEWYSPGLFEDDKEAAIQNHRNVVHEIADRLEAGELV